MPMIPRYSLDYHRPVSVDWTRTDVTSCRHFCHENMCSITGGPCMGGACPAMREEVLEQLKTANELKDLWYKEYNRLREIIKAGRYL